MAWSSATASKFVADLKKELFETRPENLHTYAAEWALRQARLQGASPRRGARGSASPGSIAIAAKAARKPPHAVLPSGEHPPSPPPQLRCRTSPANSPPASPKGSPIGKNGGGKKGSPRASSHRFSLPHELVRQSLDPKIDLAATSTHLAGFCTRIAEEATAAATANGEQEEEPSAAAVRLRQARRADLSSLVSDEGCEAAVGGSRDGDGDGDGATGRLAGACILLSRLVSEQQTHVEFLEKMVALLKDTDRGTKETLVTVATAPGAGTTAKAPPIVGLCNPLLDMTLTVSEAFLKEWGLEVDSAILAREEHKNLFEAIVCPPPPSLFAPPPATPPSHQAKHPDIKYIPGGSGLNTMRVVQWIVGLPDITRFVGATGEDDFGRILRHTTMQEGVGMVEMTVANEPTGTCAVLVTEGGKRSLVANLGASAVFEEGSLESNEELRQTLCDAPMYYVTGFFLRTAPELVLGIMERGVREGKTVALNLSAPFVLTACGPDCLARGVQSASLIFGNDSEFLALSQVLGWGLSNVEKIGKKVAALPMLAKTHGNRVVLITKGSDPLVAVTDKKTVTFYPTPLVNPADIVDTNGAGDAFVGGYLGKHYTGGSVEDCVRMGQWAASIIIRRPGCDIPPLPPGCCISLSTIRSRQRPSLSSVQSAVASPKRKPKPKSKGASAFAPSGTRHSDPLPNS